MRRAIANVYFLLFTFYFATKYVIFYRILWRHSRKSMHHLRHGRFGLHRFSAILHHNLVPRACDPWEGNEGSGIIRCRKPGILAKIELRIHFNGQSDSSLKRIIPEPSFPSQGSQARGTRLFASVNASVPSPFPREIYCDIIKSIILEVET